MTDVMETHDRKHFEVFAYYCGINRSDAPKSASSKVLTDGWTSIC